MTSVWVSKKNFGTKKITDEKNADLLHQLSFEYIDDYDKWSVITNILKGLDKKDLWNKWSYQ